MKLRHISVTALFAVVLSFLTALPAAATQTPVTENTNVAETAGFILKLKPGVAAVAPNGEPTGENYAGVDLENSRDIGGGYTAVTFGENLTVAEIELAKARLLKDPRVLSVENDQYIQTANYVAKPIAPLIFGREEPIQLPIIIKSAVRRPSMPKVTAADAWVSGTTERVKISWTKPKSRYTGYIVGYRVQVHGGGSWRTLKSQTSSKTRSYTTTTDYLSAGTTTAFRVAALTRVGRKTYVGFYKNAYVTPTVAPSGSSTISITNNSNQLQVSWNLLSGLSERGGLAVNYTVEVRQPDGNLVSCVGVTATSCVVNNISVGGEYTATLVISNAKGSFSASARTFGITASAPVNYADDPEYSKQWFLQGSNIFSARANEAWAIESGHSSVVVAVLDTGITDHPDLRGRLVSGYDFVSGDPDHPTNDGDGRDDNPSDPGDFDSQNDSSWHGTHVSGIIAASDNGEGVVGVAPNVRVQPIRVLTSNGGLLSDIVAGLNWAIGEPVNNITNPQKVNVINMSIGGQGVSCADQASTLAALSLAKQRGITVVTAAGNANDYAASSYPGNCYPTINVGATGPTGVPTFYSNFGTAVDISAPGGDYSCNIGNTGQIFSTLNSGLREPVSANYNYSNGTSMAAPVVSGVVALLYSAKFRNTASFNPDFNFVESVWRAISSTATPFSSSVPTACTSVRNNGTGGTFDGSQRGGYGAGIVNAAAAVSAILQ